MERSRFLKLASTTLEALDEVLGDLEHEDLDVNLAGDVLTLSFSDRSSFIINAHSAALQVWMAANSSAWHFDYHDGTNRWVADKTGDELFATVSRVVSEKLGSPVELAP